MPPTKGDVLRDMETIWSNIALPVKGVIMRERHTQRVTETEGEKRMK